MPKNPIIVGVDPGTTLGYAVLDFDGNVLKVGSGKELSMSFLIHEAIEHGNPVLVGCDKNPAPSFADKFAVKVGARLIFPKQDLKIEEKDAMAKGYKVKNSHEKDALASAFFALKEKYAITEKINNFCRNHGKFAIREKIIEIVLLQEKSISEAVSIIETPVEEKIVEVHERKEERDDYSRYAEKIKMLKEDLEIVREANIKLSEEVIAVKRENSRLMDRLEHNITDEEMKKLLKFKEERIRALSGLLEKKDSRMEDVSHYLGSVREFICSLEGKALAKKLDNLGMNEFEKKRKMLHIGPNDVLLVENLSVFSEKVIEMVKHNTVISKGKVPDVIREKLMVVDGSGLEINEIEDFASVDFVALQKAKSKSNLLGQIVDKYRKERGKA